MNWILSVQLRLFLAAVTLLTGVQGFTIASETDLRTNLMANYSKAVRPSSTTTVEVAFQLTALSGINLRNQQFSVAGWWSLHWNDSRLTWNQAQYPDIPVIQIYDDQIWTPALVVDNSVNTLSAIDEDTIPARVDNTGFVSWSPPGLLSVSCDMDITHFPFDTQVCVLQVTSFGYTIQELDLDIYETGLSLAYFGGDGEWNLDKTWTDRSIYTEGDYQYARVYYYFRWTRIPLYYGFNMILPVLVTAVLISLVFVLPAESGEKIGYCLTVMLAFMVILTLVAGDLPTTATNTSYLELYMAIVLILSCLSVVLSIFVLEIYHKPEEKPVPNWVNKLTIWGMLINCVDTSCCNSKVNHGEDAELPSDNVRNGNPGMKRGDTPQKHKWTRKLAELGLRPVTPQSSPEDVSRGGEITWRTVSIVLDGVLFRIYIVSMSVISCVLVAMLVAG